ncbi:hypothetical protein M422DRAFT_248701 [Sphaerobolus stellatus SS14]|nr:hypothetical protein M422DRAFT_248701 [Sphaerobolus stellatus SS14]
MSPPKRRRKAVTANEDSPPRKKAKGATVSEGGKKKAGHPTKATSASSTPAAKPSAKQATSDGNKEARINIIDWAAEHQLTWKLLSSIEDSDPHCQAFGFVTQTAVAVNSGGKTSIDQCRALARIVLIGDESGRWKNGDLKKLGDAIKNRVYNLKKKYTELRNKLSETGQGLIDDGCEAEIEEDSPLENLWQLILREFPWYRRMNALMGKSPVIGAASQNSTSPMDLSVLWTKQLESVDAPTEQGGAGNTVENKGDTDNGGTIETTESSHPASPINFDADGGSDDSYIDSHAGSPCWDGTPPPVEKPTQPTIFTTITKAADPPKSAQVSSNVPAIKPKPTKRDVMDKAKDFIDDHLGMQERVAVEKLRVRMERDKQKQKSKLEIQQLKMNAATAQRAHELEMKKMELEVLRLQQGSQTMSSSPGSSFSLFPSFTASSEGDSMGFANLGQFVQ